MFLQFAILTTGIVNMRVGLRDEVDISIMISMWIFSNIQCIYIYQSYGKCKQNYT